MTNKTRG